MWVCGFWRDELRMEVDGASGACVPQACVPQVQSLFTHNIERRPCLRVPPALPSTCIECEWSPICPVQKRLHRGIRWYTERFRRSPMAVSHPTAILQCCSDIVSTPRKHRLLLPYAYTNDFSRATTVRLKDSYSGTSLICRFTAKLACV